MAIGRKRSELGGSPLAAIQKMTDVLSNFDNFNAVQEDFETMTGDAVEPLLALDMDDFELTTLSRKWRKEHSTYDADFKSRRETNKDYWLGKQYGHNVGEYRFVDNIVFSALETLLPIVSRQNPEPLVVGHDLAIADNTAKLVHGIADRRALKVKIKKMARHWALSYIGILKLSINPKDNAIDVDVIRPQDIVLDPSGTFDGGEFLGKFIGHNRSETAEVLASMFPEKKDAITQFVSGKMGTKIRFTEWWTDDFVFWSMNNDSVILDKRQNFHWNQERSVDQMDAFGMSTSVSVPGHNHFKTPKKPFAFLSVFNLDEHPYDETSLVEQSIPLQDSVNKRGRQIDKSADDANSGWVFNNQFSEEAAKSALVSLRNNGAIITPTSSINDAVTRLNAPGLPTYVWEDMLDKREQIQNIMGTRGSTAAGIASEQTVQGKIEIRQSDTDRAALIVEHLEQSIDYLYNYIVQMIFVYYDRDMLVKLLGDENGTVYAAFIEDAEAEELLVSVKEGSMIPQDPLLRRNEAVELFGMGVLDPLTMFERMNFPNPKQALQRLIQYQQNPMSLLEDGNPGQPPMNPQEQQLPPQVSPEMQPPI